MLNIKLFTKFQRTQYPFCLKDRVPTLRRESRDCREKPQLEWYIICQFWATGKKWENVHTQNPALGREDCNCSPERGEERDGQETHLYSRRSTTDGGIWGTIYGWGWGEWLAAGGHRQNCGWSSPQVGKTQTIGNWGKNQTQRCLVPFFFFSFS